MNESSLGHTEINYFWDMNDKVRTLSSYYVLLIQNKNEPLLNDVHGFNSVNLL